MTTKVVNKTQGACFDVFVGRPSVWGNPFAVDKGKLTQGRYLVKTLSEALRGYEEHLLQNEELIEKAKKELKGKTLGCFCVNDLTGKGAIICHAQILARVADGRKLPIFGKTRK